jgi:hypothetical protein
MAKNINIETSNGTLVLTGSKAATVTAKGGQLIIDLGNGTTKTYPLASVLGWEIGTTRTGARADRFKNEVADAKSLVTSCVSKIIGRCVIPETSAQDIIDASCDLTAALDSLAATEKKAAKHVEWLGKREDRKVARDAKKAKAAAAAAKVDEHAASNVAASKAKRTRKVA